MKITIRTPKSRNPLVAITHFRRAGTHTGRAAARCASRPAAR